MPLQKFPFSPFCNATRAQAHKQQKETYKINEKKTHNLFSEEILQFVQLRKHSQKKKIVGRGALGRHSSSAQEAVGGMVRLLAPLVMRDLVSKHLLSSGCTRKTSEACALRLQSYTLAPLRFEKTRTSTYACCYCFPVPNFALAQQSHETVEETNGRVLRNIHYTFYCFF